MSKSINSHIHLSLQEREIILTGIINGSTKTSIANTIGKKNPQSGKKLNCIDSFLLSAICLWNAKIIKMLS